MSSKPLSLAALVIVVCGSWSFVRAQDAQGDNPNQDRPQTRRQSNGQNQGQGRSQRRGPNGSQNRGPRGFGPRFGQGFGPGPGPGFGPGPGPGFGPGFGGGRGFGSGQFTPEQREQFYSRYVNRQVERLTRTYELDDTQRQQVQQQLEAIRDEDRTTADQRQEQMTGLRKQMRELRDRSNAGEQVNPDEWQQVRNQMREVMSGSPLMNRERITNAVEQLLPPDQAARGRERLAQQQQEWNRRREEMRQQMEQYVQQGGDPQEFFRQRAQRRRQQADQAPQEPASQPQEPAVQPENPPAETQQQPAAEANPSDSDTGNQGDDGEGRRGGNRERRRRSQRDDSQPLPADPLGPWEQYVRTFSRRYKLDASQQMTAQSILRDLLAQRKLIEDAHRTDIAFAQQIEDPARRQQQLDSINAPIARLFEELKTKLDRLPTSNQRQAAEGRRPTTRPAAATTPAAKEPTTQPAPESPTDTNE